MTRRTVLGLLALLLVVGGIIWLVSRKKSETAAAPVLSVTALNQTKNSPAGSVTANPGDIIVYTLTAENQSDETIPGYIVEANIADITDKATLMDAQGASYNSATNSLVWTPLDIPARSSVTKTFTVKVNTLASGSSNSVLKIKFNNELNVALGAPVIAGNQTPAPRPNSLNAPKTGPSSWLPAVFASVSTLFVLAIRRHRLVKT